MIMWRLCIVWRNGVVLAGQMVRLAYPTVVRVLLGGLVLELVRTAHPTVVGVLRGGLVLGLVRMAHHSVVGIYRIGLYGLCRVRRAHRYITVCQSVTL